MKCMRAFALNSAAAMMWLFFGLSSLNAQVGPDVVGALERLAEAYNREDWNAVGELHSVDAIAMPPSQAPSEGRVAIQSMWEQFRSAGISDLTFSSGTVEIEGKMAHQFGSYSMDVGSGEGGGVIGGNFLAVWYQDGNGAWQIERFSWNVVP
jgi:ketosteroid isomerase-like protein